MTVVNKAVAHPWQALVPFIVSIRVGRSTGKSADARPVGCWFGIRPGCSVVAWVYTKLVGVGFAEVG